MLKYLIHRLLLFIPTLLGITLICFLIINLAPGGPLERQLYKLRFGGSALTDAQGESQHHKVSQEWMDQLKKQYGLDQPIIKRYFIWLKNVITLDFGDSFIYEEPAMDIIASKLPVSLQFGFFSFLLMYFISIPLGIYKAVRDGTRLDVFSSFILIVMYALPPLVLGILLKTYFTGSVFMDWFPVGDLYSDYYHEKGFWGKIVDRLHHFILPLICYTIGHFTVLTLLMKNSMLECIHSDYIRTAYAKGLNKKNILLKHAFKNALIPLATGIGNFVQIFLAGSLIIEKIFNLDGIGLLGFNAALERDFHVLLALLFIQAVLNITGRLISDFCLCLVNPRITFSK